MQKHPRDLNLEILSSFIFLRRIKAWCVGQCIDSYFERTKEIRGQNSQLLLSFVKPHGPVSTPAISRWIMMVLNLFGIDTKTFGGHSTRTASSSKAKEADVSTKEILKHGFWSKE